MIDLSSNQWRAALEKGFNAEVEALSQKGEFASIVTFNVAGFKVGYLNFPIPAFNCNESFLSEVVSQGKKTETDLMIVNSYEELEFSSHFSVQSQQSRIVPDLSSWPSVRLNKAKRTASKWKASKLVIGLAEKRDVDAIYQMYKNSVIRQRGVPKYPRSYFESLVDLGVAVARLDNEICGYIIYGIKGGRGFYLHGGYDPAYKQYYPSDILFWFMVNELRSSGCESLDLLPSPKGQDGLDNYKKKWGGEPKELLCYTVLLNPIKGRLFLMGKKLYSSTFRLLGGLAAKH